MLLRGGERGGYQVADYYLFILVKYIISSVFSGLT